jgi:TolB-like protein
MRPTVAVLPFDNGAIMPDLAPLSKGIPGMMITELARNANIRVVERDNVQKILDEQNMGGSGRIDEATIVKIGKILGAKYMITGSFASDPGKHLRVDVRCFNTETGQIIYTDFSSGTIDGLMDVVQTAAGKASTGMKLPQLQPGPARDAANKEAAVVKKMPLATAMLYARALEASDSGNKAEAKTLYAKVVAQFPYPPAEKALKDLDASR